MVESVSRVGSSAHRPPPPHGLPTAPTHFREPAHRPGTSPPSMVGNIAHPTPRTLPPPRRPLLLRQSEATSAPAQPALLNLPLTNRPACSRHAKPQLPPLARGLAARPLHLQGRAAGHRDPAQGAGYRTVRRDGPVHGRNPPARVPGGRERGPGHHLLQPRTGALAHPRRAADFFKRNRSEIFSRFRHPAGRLPRAPLTVPRAGGRTDAIPT